MILIRFHLEEGNYIYNSAPPRDEDAICFRMRQSEIKNKIYNVCFCVNFSSSLSELMKLKRRI